MKAILVTDGAKAAPAVFGQYDRLFCKAKDAAALDLFPDAEPLEVVTDSGLANQALERMDEEHVLLMHQSFCGIWEADTDQNLQEDAMWDAGIIQLRQLIDAYKTSLGGFGHARLGKIHSVFPVSTIQPPSTEAILVDKSRFSGFVTLPYHYMVMDAFLRAIHDYGAIVRVNLYHTNIHPFGLEDTVDFDQFTNLWKENLSFSMRKEGTHFQFKKHAYGI